MRSKEASWSGPRHYIYFIYMYTSHNIMAFNIIYIFKISFKGTLISFFLFIKTHIINLIYIIFIDFRFGVLVCCFYTLYFMFSCRMISSTACWTIALLSFFLLNFFIFSGFCLRSLVVLLLEYLEPKSPKTLHSSDEFPSPRTRQISFYLYLGWSVYLFLVFPALALILE